MKTPRIKCLVTTFTVVALVGKVWTGTTPPPDTDECASNPCQNGGTCTDGDNSYTCSCDSGYSGTNCDSGQGTDECASNPCQNGGTCTDGDNSYTCSCDSGYSGTNCDSNSGQVNMVPTTKALLLIAVSKIIWML